MELSNLPLPTHPLPASPHSQQSTGPSPSDGPFGRAGAAAPVGSDPRPFVLASFLSTIPRSDSWHRFGRNFTLRLISAPTVPVASGRCLCSLFPALSSAGVTISRPYLPSGRYQASLGHTCLFPTVSPANTLVRWAGTLCLRLHSAGSTITHLWPTGSSLGSLPRLQPGGSPQALQTSPRGERPALRSSVRFGQ